MPVVNMPLYTKISQKLMLNLRLQIYDYIMIEFSVLFQLKPFCRRVFYF